MDTPAQTNGKQEFLNLTLNDGSSESFPHIVETLFNSAMLIERSQRLSSSATSRTQRARQRL